jgi:hypothetical protein
MKDAAEFSAPDVLSQRFVDQLGLRKIRCEGGGGLQGLRIEVEGTSH